MKKHCKNAINILTCAALLSAPLSGFAPGTLNSITSYAGENDFKWSSYKSKDSSWWSSSEATDIADEIVQYQLSDGGWRKDMKTESSGSWGKSTIDNNATWGQIRFLAKTYNATKAEKYKTSCLKGIDLLINGQYDNGGWPQVFGDAGTYHAHITYNDNAMVEVLNIMQEIAKQSSDFAFVDSTRREKAAKAVDNGIQCILNTQIVSGGVKPSWGQQHDEFTLAPAGARAYEVPSICTQESVGVVNFLLALENPSAEVKQAINAAIT